ncbi:helix-turn-helix transcriptional regulator [Mycobacteroides abscessus]|uniref:helix-turn-helix transcriptional regulator n=1 Tax=Mycobacteroides abscessus TaxID=36809 RepID=UPI000929D450|nr:hypothetical protein [Mycobacteroides abscessus]SIF34799.1 Uncharacterised protein [Mycobacteroides abscessus subsp. abscessus]
MTETATLPASGWLRPKEVAAAFPISENALAMHRKRGTGPKFHRVPDQNRVIYHVEDIEAWLRGEGK